jgi:dihydrofolate reductase
MGRLIYLTLASLDGFIEDERGEFGWAAPDEEVHRFINEISRGAGTYLYGRRMYETMTAWEDPDDFAGAPGYILDFMEIWQAADKVVYSKSLGSVETGRTTLEREFDPGAVASLKRESDRDLGIGGAALAATAIEAGLVDELQLFLCPVIVGGGKRALPAGVCAELELIEERRFGNGTVFLRYLPA